METENGRIGIASTTAQVFSVFNDDASPLGVVLPVIIETMRKYFPLIDFNLRSRAEGGLDIVIHQLDVFLSSGFASFLDRVAESLTIEQYMLLGFINEDKEPVSEIRSRSVSSFRAMAPVPELHATITEGGYFTCMTQSSLNWVFEKMIVGSEAA
jgi:hypothetical protein